MFEVTTEYDKKALLTMNRVANKTSHKWQFRVRRMILLVLGLWCLGAGLLLLMVFGKLGIGSRIVAIAASLTGIVALGKGIFLERLGARASRKMMIEGSSRWTLRFDEGGFSGENGEGVESAYPYSKIQEIFETRDYFLLQIDKAHSVILDNNGFTQGTCEEFRRFIAEKTGLEPRFVKI